MARNRRPRQKEPALPAEQKQLLNFSELCRYLGRSPKTVRRMLAEGELPPKAFKKYWSKPQIDEFLKNKIPEPQTTAEEMADEILRKVAIHAMKK